MSELHVKWFPDVTHFSNYFTTSSILPDSIICEGKLQWKIWYQFLNYGLVKKM